MNILHSFWQATRCPAIVILVILAGSVALYNHFGEDYFLNLSTSAPLGLWHIEHDVPITDLHRDDWIIACPDLTPDEVAVLYHRRWLEHCSETTCPCRPVLKRIVGLPGDRVTVTVDGTTSIHSRRATALRHRGDGIALPQLQPGTHVLQPNEFWLMNDTPQSVDSRYYGPVHLREIESHVRPLITLSV